MQNCHTMREMNHDSTGQEQNNAVKKNLFHLKSEASDSRRRTLRTCVALKVMVKRIDSHVFFACVLSCFQEMQEMHA